MITLPMIESHGNRPNVLGTLVWSGNVSLWKKHFGTALFFIVYSREANVKETHLADSRTKGESIMTAHSRSSFQVFWKEPRVADGFRSGVSLHSHTMYSEESLDMVPRYTEKVPYLGQAIRRQEQAYRRKNQRPFSFADAFWTPPLAPRQAVRLEEKQIQRKFALPALVSLTDHDDIRAGAQLRVLERFKKVPISTEWTIPFQATFFHLGVHNMPLEDSEELMKRFAAFTANPDPDVLDGLLAMLNALPDVLLVLNHPLWDEKGIAAERHAAALEALLARYGSYFHALELNGLRGWSENKEVVALGKTLDLPLVAGGDRHGREPNAILNLSRARTFAEFSEEVRRERVSHVVFMPQYREPLKLRVLQTMVDVVREYPENFGGRRTWADRVHYRDPETQLTVPLSELWPDGGPAIVKHFVAAMRIVGWTPFRSALRLALNERAAIWSE